MSRFALAKILLALAAILLSGCSGLSEKVSTGFGLWGGQSVGEKPAVLVEFKPSTSLKLEWQARVGSAGDTMLFPAVLKDDVYAVGQDGKIARFDIDTGKQALNIDSGYKVSAALALDPA